MRDGKLNAIVARSTFRNQIAQSTSLLEHFWMLKRRFVWAAHGIVHLANSEQNVTAL
jgi:hypothetical protein